MAIKEIELNIPQSWNDVSLKKFLKLQSELKNYEEDEAKFAVMLTILCGLDEKYLGGIALTDYFGLQRDLASFMNNVESPLSKYITIDGVEYGFEPNLSEMSYGAYVDITQYKEIAINDNWAKIMNILYRPVIDKKVGFYAIQPYTGDTNYEKWLDVPMDKHFGALFFLLNLSMDLAKSTLKYSKVTDLTQNWQQILGKSGEVISQFTNWHKETSTDLIP